MRAELGYRVAGSDDPKCVKGSHGILTLFDSTARGIPDSAKLRFGRTCTGHDHTYTRGIGVKLTLRAHCLHSRKPPDCDF